MAFLAFLQKINRDIGLNEMDGLIGGFIKDKDLQGQLEKNLATDDKAFSPLQLLVNFFEYQLFLINKIKYEYEETDSTDSAGSEETDSTDSAGSEETDSAGSLVEKFNFINLVLHKLQEDLKPEKIQIDTLTDWGNEHIIQYKKTLAQNINKIITELKKSSEKDKEENFSYIITDREEVSKLYKTDSDEIYSTKNLETAKSTLKDLNVRIFQKMKKKPHKIKNVQDNDQKEELLGKYIIVPIKESEFNESFTLKREKIENYFFEKTELITVYNDQKGSYTSTLSPNMSTITKTTNPDYLQNKLIKFLQNEIKRLNKVKIKGNSKLLSLKTEVVGDLITKLNTSLSTKEDPLQIIEKWLKEPVQIKNENDEYKFVGIGKYKGKHKEENKMSGAISTHAMILGSKRNSFLGLFSRRTKFVNNLRKKLDIDINKTVQEEMKSLNTKLSG